MPPVRSQRPGRRPWTPSRTIFAAARWPTARQLAPAAVDVRALRRYVAGLSADGQAPSTVARKLASLRGLFAVQMALRARAENPAELLGSPKRPQRLPRVLKADEVAV